MSSIKNQEVQVESLGIKELYIPNKGIQKCRFYRVYTIKPIKNENAFSFHIPREAYGTGEDILVTFDGPLRPEEVEEKEKQVEVLVIEEMYYHLAYYYMLYEDRESAEMALAYTQDIAAYQSLANCYSQAEKQLALIKLEQLLKNPSKRYQKGKVPIKVGSLKESLCLLEVLKMIIEDDGCQLLWKYEKDYNYTQVKNKMIEDDYTFVYPESGYGVITNLSIGSRKLNVGVRTKIDGFVEEKATGLKVGASIYRDYMIIVNGNLNVDTLWCELSNTVLKQLRKEKILKKPISLRTKMIYPLNLTKLKVTNERILRMMGQQEIAKTLYTIQMLGCKERVLRQILKNKIKEAKDGVNSPLEEEARQIRRRFQIDEKGIYAPFKIEKREDLPFKVYPATILEWKIEKFPMKRMEKELLNEYESWTDREEDKAEEVQSLIRQIQHEKKQLKNKVNLVRIASALMHREIFSWDQTIEKEKIETDKILEINVILGGKVRVSTKKIDGMIVRQDYYTILIRCTE